MAEETVVVVHGSRYPNPDIKNLFLRKLVRFGYRLFNITPDMDYPKKREEWLSNIQKSGREVLYLNWEGKPLPKYINNASIALANLIKNMDNVKIVTNSIGAAIALKTAERINNISKIISLTGVYRKSKANVEFLDIRSKADTFANICKVALNIFSFRRMKNRKVVRIEKFKHHDFQKEKEIQNGEFKGTTLSFLINSLLQENSNVNAKQKV